MQLAGSPSWRISEDRWPQCFDWALWFRAAERIEVGSGGVVPGPADVEPLPDSSADAPDAAELAAGWLAWWHSLTQMPPLSLRFDRADPPCRPELGVPLRDALASNARWLGTQLAFGPPGFPGLAGWPVLRRAVTGRWEEAHDWHTARQRAGLEAGAHLGMRANRVVAEMERELGRKARPFSVDFVLLPVRDDQVRPIGPGRYLVSERLYDGPQWPELLHALLIPRA